MHIACPDLPFFSHSNNIYLPMLSISGSRLLSMSKCTHRSQCLQRNIFTNEQVKILITHSVCVIEQEINMDFGAGVF